MSDTKVAVLVNQSTSRIGLVVRQDTVVHDIDLSEAEGRDLLEKLISALMSLDN